MKLPLGFVICTTVCALTLVACAKDAPTAPSSTTSPTAPSTPSTPSAPVPTKLVPTTPTMQSGWAGFPVLTMPGVQVLDQNGKPVSDASLTFTFTAHNGAPRVITVPTNTDGVAYTYWTLPVDGRQDTVVASLGALAPVVFIADATKQAIIATFNLQTIGGQGLPIAYSGGGSSWSVDGGQFVLAADNSYAWGYQVDGASRVRPEGLYLFADPNTVKFYLTPGTYGPFYQQRSGLFATGVIDGGKMTVTYEDFIDFELEVYSKSQ